MSPINHEAPVYARIDLEIADGEGVHVRASDGREYLDLYGGHAVALLGHRNPGLLAALARQAERLFFQTNLVELEVRRAACAALAGIAPTGLDRVFLVSSGAEANENALRLAFRATRRARVVAITGGFHGRTAAAGACTDGAAKWYGFPRTPFDVTFARADDRSSLDAAISDDTAAVILEAVQGVAGAYDLDLDFLRLARRLTRERGAWLIADEVQCGMGRTGLPFAISAADVIPDALTVAKGLAGGFPAGAVLMSAATAASLAAGDLGTTFGGGPMAAALIVEVIAQLRAPGFLANVGDISDYIRATCNGGVVERIQGRGLLLGFVCRAPARDVLSHLRARGILAGGAADPRVVRIMPPLTLERAHVDQLAAALSSFSGAAFTDLQP